jgi:hypothetical protein
MSWDFPFREIGNRDIGSPGNKGSRLSMMETLKQLWTVRFEMATCCETTHFEDRGFSSSDDKNSDFRHDKS